MQIVPLKKLQEFETRFKRSVLDPKKFHIHIGQGAGVGDIHLQIEYNGLDGVNNIVLPIVKNSPMEHTVVEFEAPPKIDMLKNHPVIRRLDDTFLGDVFLLDIFVDTIGG